MAGGLLLDSAADGIELASFTTWNRSTTWVAFGKVTLRTAASVFDTLSVPTRIPSLKLAGLCLTLEATSA